MGNVLGLVGSARRWGNSELLVRQVLRGAEAEGSSVQMIRMTALHLESCTGCMRCIIGGKPCPIDDDMVWLLEAVQAADALVLAAPTYFLGPAAVVKLVLDRLLMVTGRLEEELPAIRPAVTISTAGLHDWRGIALPFLNALVTALGYVPVDSLLAVAPGPGEVLLDRELMSRVLDAGRRLGRLELETVPPPPNICPVCRCDSFVVEGNRAVCPICAQEGRFEQDECGVQLRFDPKTGSDHRWTPAGLRAHMTDWVLATGPRFLAHRAEIKAQRKRYRELEVQWLCPPAAEDAGAAAETQ